ISPAHKHDSEARNNVPSSLCVNADLIASASAESMRVPQQQKSKKVTSKAAKAKLIIDVQQRSSSPTGIIASSTRPPSSSSISSSSSKNRISLGPAQRLVKIENVLGPKEAIERITLLPFEDGCFCSNEGCAELISRSAQA